jgi:hypothetical protein
MPSSARTICVLLMIGIVYLPLRAVTEPQPLSPSELSALSSPDAAPLLRPLNWTSKRDGHCPDASKVGPDNTVYPQCDTSEEYPPITVRHGSLIGGFRCYGRYCDNVGIGSERIYFPAEQLWRIGDNYWTSYFSEEDDPWHYRECANEHWMTGISCNGRYCDNIALQCTEIAFSRRSACEWGPKFSEEEHWFIIPPNRYAVGIACFGSNCDNKSVKHCVLER